MSKQKVFELQSTNVDTGEVTSIPLDNLKFRKVTDETFGMHRTTEGVEWVLRFTGVELQMLIILLEIEDIKTGYVVLSKLIREHLASSNMFDMSDRSIRAVIASLEDKNALVRLSSNDILLNPEYFYKGGTKMWKAKYEKFKEERDKKKEEKGKAKLIVAPAE